jgi:hypothetical protein
VFLIAVPTLFLPITDHERHSQLTHVQLETGCCLTCIFGAASDLFFFKSIILRRFRTKSFCDFFVCDSRIIITWRKILNNLGLVTVIIHDFEFSASSDSTYSPEYLTTWWY